MRCSGCGCELKPGEGFCPLCGNPSGSVEDSADVVETRSEGTTPATPRRGMNRYKMAAASLVVLALILVLIAGSSAMGGHADDGRQVNEVGDLIVDGSLNSDLIRIYSDDGSGQIEYVGQGSDIEWLVLDISKSAFVKDGDVYDHREFTHLNGPSISLTEPGYYEVMLYVDGHLTVIGDALLRGSMVEDYEWSRTVDGESFDYSVHFEYEFTDFYRYSMDSTGRILEEGMDPAEFAVVDRTILRLSDDLRDEYLDVHGEDAPTDGQDYANYLLSFVQMIIGFPDQIAYVDGHFVKSGDGCGDLYLYGAEEYWAYPMETLYYRMGDCEDTSVLYCALLSASGYTSGMVLLPSHVLVGVILDDYVSDPSGESQYHFVSVEVDGETMYVGDTAFDDYVPLGYIAKVHMVDPDSIILISTVQPYTV